ncbi:protein Wnt-4-like [Agrilus planipennis]|uniref:Protein Wnt n=1 Tax=Agrilus planipennis TaxID=224129 RepID=A0A7F5R0A5_AGRPL|nr:protein Wnt-4-like [Agrilus planipennis]
MFSWFLFIILLYNGVLSDYYSNRTGESNKVNFPKLARRRSIVSLIFSHNDSNASTSAANGDSNVSTNVTPCRWLRGFKHQNKMCRKRKGLSQALLIAKHLAVVSCKEQFRFERWNCSYKKSIFRKIYRETALLYAMSGAAIAYSIARACSEGTIHNCRCARPESNEQPRHHWKWGGCGDNTKQAKKITESFLQLKRKKENDSFSITLNYNTEVGLATLSEVEMKVCTCHGVSASCVMKTCWKRLQPFPKVAQKLRDRYHSAILPSPENTVKQKNLNKRKYSRNLIYFEQSPTYCQETVGRECTDADNCATLCCGRDHSVLTLVLQSWFLILVLVFGKCTKTNSARH